MRRGGKGGEGGEGRTKTWERRRALHDRRAVKARPRCCCGEGRRGRLASTSRTPRASSPSGRAGERACGTTPRAPAAAGPHHPPRPAERRSRGCVGGGRLRGGRAGWEMGGGERGRRYRVGVREGR
jgi:hypothetical protein